MCCKIQSLTYSVKHRKIYVFWLSNFMPIELNSDSFEIKNYELTPEGFLKFWLVGGIPGKELVYDGGRKEIINSDALFDENSINSAVGKPISFNHPPRAITSKNYKQYSHGIVLQEYAKDDSTGALVLAGIVHDADMVDGIMKGKYKYVSAGYSADKTPNNDGVLLQSNRSYNHFGILDENHAPRAGEESKIIKIDDSIDNSQSDAGVNNNQQNLSKPAKTETHIAPASTPQTTNEDMTQEINERVDLLLEWKPVLLQNNKACSSNMDSKQIKRQVLSIYYPEKTMNLINADNIDGVWLGFLTTANINTDAGENDTFAQSNLMNYRPKVTTPASQQVVNFDSAVDSAIDVFIKKMEGKV